MIHQLIKPLLHIKCLATLRVWWSLWIKKTKNYQERHFSVIRTSSCMTSRTLDLFQRILRLSYIDPETTRCLFHSAASVSAAHLIFVGTLTTSCGHIKYHSSTCTLRHSVKSALMTLSGTVGLRWWCTSHVHLRSVSDALKVKKQPRWKRCILHVCIPGIQWLWFTFLFQVLTVEGKRRETMAAFFHTRRLGNTYICLHCISKASLTSSSWTQGRFWLQNNVPLTHSSSLRAQQQLVNPTSAPNNDLAPRGMSSAELGETRGKSGWGGGGGCLGGGRGGAGLHLWPQKMRTRRGWGRVRPSSSSTPTPWRVTQSWHPRVGQLASVPPSNHAGRRGQETDRRERG